MNCLFFKGQEARNFPNSSSPNTSISYRHTSVQFSSVAQACPTLCNPMNRSTPGLPVHHQLPEFTQTHVHRVGDAIQPSHPLSSPFPPALNPSQHQSLFQRVCANSLAPFPILVTRALSSHSTLRPLPNIWILPAPHAEVSGQAHSSLFTQDYTQVSPTLPYTNPPLFIPRPPLPDVLWVPCTPW